MDKRMSTTQHTTAWCRLAATKDTTFWAIRISHVRQTALGMHIQHATRQVIFHDLKMFEMPDFVSLTGETYTILLWHHLETNVKVESNTWENTTYVYVFLLTSAVMLLAISS
jgi:hypothetical protein